MKNLYVKTFIIALALLLAGCASTSKYQPTSGGKCDTSNKIASKNKLYGYPLNGFEGNPIRLGESVQQIWIGPYEDKDGNFHEPSYVYTVIKKGSWLGDPAKDIQE